MGEKGWLKTSEYRHIGGRGFKIAQKKRHIFDRSLMLCLSVATEGLGVNPSPFVANVTSI